MNKNNIEVFRHKLTNFFWDKTKGSDVIFTWKEAEKILNEIKELEVNNYERT